MIDFTQARRTMVDSQLRTFDVNDIRLLDAIDAVPRERFVLPGSEQLAYSDQELAVSEGADRRFMVTPMVLARMIQALEIDAGDTVLDVACGRGYSSAILSELGAYVTAWKRMANWSRRPGPRCPSRAQKGWRSNGATLPTDLQIPHPTTPSW